MALLGTHRNSLKGINLRTYVPLDFDSPRLNDADTALTLTVNILVTLLISFRLIRAQRKAAKILDNADSQRLYLGIVAILVESAMPVTVFGIGFLISKSLYDNSGSFDEYSASSVLGTLFDIAAVSESIPHT